MTSPSPTAPAPAVTAPSLKATHWVVITTINYPTSVITRLVKLPNQNWHVVVVADQKTPSDWLERLDSEVRSTGRVILLTLEDQRKMGSAIYELLPFNHYARKNLGYLYAISHGASVIYETDDDNLLLSTVGVLPLPARSVRQIVSLDANATQYPVYNAYKYFGHPTIWPRGYPLEHVAHEEVPELICEMYGDRSLGALVQQGLENGDPDVDAIYRVTQRRSHTEPIRLEFDASLPAIALAPTVFCPFNKQNTYFHAEAFWGLLVPVTTSFRVCDIWRGYFVQRLLWDIGGELAFLPPSVFQDRNVQDYISDFSEEQQLYMQAGKLVAFLMQWQSSHLALFSRMKQLARDMYTNGFWLVNDLHLVEAWIADLQRVGYPEPAVIRSELVREEFHDCRLLP